MGRRLRALCEAVELEPRVTAFGVKLGPYEDDRTDGEAPPATVRITARAVMELAVPLDVFPESVAGILVI